MIRDPFRSSDTLPNFLQRLLRDVREREWLEKGATLTVPILARWCRAVVSPEFGGAALVAVDDLVEFLRMELCIVEQQFFKSQGSGGAMEEAAPRPDVDVEAVEAAKKVVARGAFPAQADEPSPLGAPGRMEKCKYIPL